VQLREIRADLPIIVSTGYAEFLQTNRVHGFQPNIVLSKPVTMDELRDALHAVIPDR
jgi:CheY-like chemotaxis protein